MTMMTTAIATITAGTKGGTRTATVMMTMAEDFATTVLTGAIRTYGTTSLSAASIHARGILFSTTVPIGWWRPTMFIAAATGNGTGTASTSMTTTAILAGTCSSILG